MSPVHTCEIRRSTSIRSLKNKGKDKEKRCELAPFHRTFGILLSFPLLFKFLAIQHFTSVNQVWLFILGRPVKSNTPRFQFILLLMLIPQHLVLAHAEKQFFSKLVFGCFRDSFQGLLTGEKASEVLTYTLQPCLRFLTPPRGGTWIKFSWVCAAGLSEPPPHYSLFCGQL